MKPWRKGLAWQWQRRRKRLDAHWCWNLNRVLSQKHYLPAGFTLSISAVCLGHQILRLDTRQRLPEILVLHGNCSTVASDVLRIHRRYFSKFGSIEGVFLAHGWPREKHDETNSIIDKEQLSQDGTHLLSHILSTRTAAGASHIKCLIKSEIGNVKWEILHPKKWNQILFFTGHKALLFIFQCRFILAKKKSLIGWHSTSKLYVASHAPHMRVLHAYGTGYI